MAHLTSQVTVVWYTDVSADSWVDYGLTPSYGSSASGPSGSRHEVTLTGLIAATSYYYRVRSGGVNLATGTFKTAKTSGMPFRIVAFSDAHYGGNAALGQQMALYDPDLLLAPGDLADNGLIGDLHTNVFLGLGPVLRRAALYWTPGNHDTANSYAACREIFTLPPDELNYWFEYADAQIVSLNSEGLPGPSWLANALAASDKPWKIVFFHQAARSASGGHGENATIRDTYVPIMEQYGVQLALAGHNHYWWRSVPLNGVTHLITGRSGTRARELGTMPAYSAAGMNGTEARSFAVIDFSWPFLQIRGITEYGNLIDDTVIDQTCAFVLDGVLDPTAMAVATRPGGLTIYAAIVGRYLYVATQDAGEGNDIFILVATSPAGMTNAPWAKAGQVMRYAAFVADENENRYSGWFNAQGAPMNDLLVARSATPWYNGGVLEGVLDLDEMFGGRPPVLYFAAVAYTSADGGTLVASQQCPAGNGNGDLEPAEFVGVPSGLLVRPFVLDGKRDHDGYLIADNNGMKLWAAVYGQTLYVATWAAGDSGGPNDHFIFVTDELAPLQAAPWAKAGQVAFAVNAKPYLADEGANNWVAWYNGGASAACAAGAVNSRQMEGTLDLVQVFGKVPTTLYVAVAPYSTADGGALYAPSQVPAGNGDGNIDAAEFLVIPVEAIRDSNADGRFDVLDPQVAFYLQLEGGTSPRLKWVAIPGHRYRVQSAVALAGPFVDVTGDMVAAQGQFSLTYEPALSGSLMFFRLVQPSP